MRKSKFDQLLEDAEEAGFEVTNEDDGSVLVAKFDKRTGRVLRGIQRFANGTAVDAWLSPEVQKGIISVAVMRDILEI